jgi:hypothetical protein
VCILLVGHACPGIYLQFECILLVGHACPGIYLQFECILLVGHACPGIYLQFECILLVGHACPGIYLQFEHILLVGQMCASISQHNTIKGIDRLVFWVKTCFLGVSLFIVLLRQWSRFHDFLLYFILYFAFHFEMYISGQFLDIRGKDKSV